jgi:hypothetical protein
MKLRRFGFLAALVAAFTAGSKLGVKYAMDHYVTRDRKFIEGKVIKDEE